MADRKKHVVPNIATSSRFAVFETEKTDSSEDELVISGTSNTQEQKKKNKNAKKRARKKKKAAAENAATNELRNMAFGKAAPGAKQKVHTNIDGEKKVHHEKTIISNKEEEKPPSLLKDDFEKWTEVDEQIVLNQFQKDLQEAVRLSVVEEEERKKTMLESMQARKHKKEQVVKLSLDEFQNRNAKPIQNGHHETINGNEAIDDWDAEQLPQQVEVEIKREKQRKKKKKHVEKQNHNKDAIVQDVNSESKKQMEVIDMDGLHAANLAQWKSDLDNKEKENDELRLEIENLKDELAQVKKRNKQLCFILGQGEMRDKSEILLQIEELTSVKDELSSELKDMHSALEQERSKVSSLKLELSKYQGGPGRTKKHSSCEQDV